MEKQNNTEKTLPRFKYLEKLTKDELEVIIKEERTVISDLSKLIECYNEFRRIQAERIGMYDAGIKRWDDAIAQSAHKITFVKQLIVQAV